MRRSPDIEAAAAAVMNDVETIDVIEMEGGSSAFVARLMLRSHHNRSRTVVFRQHVDKLGKAHHGDVASKEFHLTSQLSNDGLPIAAPLAVHGGHHTDGPWLVSEFVDGHNAIGRLRDQALIDQMADILARLHKLDPARFAVPGLVPIEDPLAALPRYLADDEVGSSVRSALDGHTMRKANRPCLLHGDYWPGNVMISDETIVAVLDWEDAKIGDPLVDLACARVEIACDGGAAAAERFTAVYCNASPDLVLDDLAVWDVYVSATALSGMHLWGLSAEAEASRRSTTAGFLADASQRLRHQA